MRDRLENVKTNTLRDFFGATRWKKFTQSVDQGDPERVQALVIGARKSIADFCRKVYLENRREK